MIRLKEKYSKEIIPEMRKEFGYKSNMAVPKVSKIVVNMGLGKFLRDGSKDDLEKIIKDLTNITGQKPVITKAKKAIAGFKIREGMPVGLMATLRGVRMYEFMDRLVSVTLPQIRDFRGLSKKAFDKNGNFSIGIKEHIIFFEVNKEDIKHILGMEINIVTTAKTDEEACKLLKGLGFPIVE
ncbi:MAG: 50S ribosomal protein L5 [Patescibacteria group bacterium]|nr:50S ribosomal protein L5 [Patescibacteria group bacterium]